MRTNGVDTIEISTKDYELIKKWSDNEPDFLPRFKPILPKFIISVSNSELPEVYFQIFVQSLEDGRIRIVAYSAEGTIHDIIYNPTDSFIKINEVNDGFRGQPQVVDYLIKSSVLFVAVISIFITTFQSNKDYVFEDIQRVRKMKKNSHNKKRTVYLNKRVIKIYPQRVTDSDRALIQRHIESWSVRGHWRQLKSGKSVWVKPHMRGTGNFEAKTYRVSNTTDDRQNSKSLRQLR